MFQVFQEVLAFVKKYAESASWKKKVSFQLEELRVQKKLSTV